MNIRLVLLSLLVIGFINCTNITKTADGMDNNSVKGKGSFRILKYDFIETLNGIRKIKWNFDGYQDIGDKYIQLYSYEKDYQYDWPPVINNQLPDKVKRLKVVDEIIEKNNKIIFLTQKGILIYDNNFRQYYPYFNMIKNTNVEYNDIFISPFSDLLIVATNLGLIEFNLELRTYNILRVSDNPLSNYVYNIFIKNNNIFVCTKAGLYKYNFDKMRFIFCEKSEFIF